ncbi:hypothetical protein V3C33_15640 [Micrococcaceae bacterium Sec5.7]
MTPQKQESEKLTQAKAAAPDQEFYLPTGGMDPDFYIPADRGHGPGPFSRWMHRLPVVGWLLS